MRAAEAYGSWSPAGPPEVRRGVTWEGRWDLLRRDPTTAQRRVALLALAAALGLGVAGRIAIHAGGHLPHGDAFAALGGAAVALGGPWLAAAWSIGALAGSPARGALDGGGAALALGTAAWYLLTVAAGGRAAVAYAVPVAAAWAAVGGLRRGRALRPGRRRLARRTAAGCAPRRSPRSRAPWRARRCCSPGVVGPRGRRWCLTTELSVGIGLLAAARRRAPLGLTLLVFAVAAVAFAGIEDSIRDT